MEHRRSTIQGRYHSIEIYDCPIEVLSVLANKVKLPVTVENIRPVGSVVQWYESKQALFPGAEIAMHSLRDASYDATLSNKQFLDNMSFWDSRGVFAVFSHKAPIAFKVTALDVPARYRALDNFGFLLVAAIGGPSSSGWSELVSPNIELIDLAESVLLGDGKAMHPTSP